MSIQPLNCPNCGSPDVHGLKDDIFTCQSCGSNSVLNPERQILILLSNDVSCPKCGKPNDASASFCGSCGVQLVFPCPFCISVHQPGERFCPHCGELMRGIPKTQPHEVLASIEQDFNRRNKKSLLYPGLPNGFGEAIEIKSLLNTNDIALWSFFAPRNEAQRRNVFGSVLFVIDNNLLLRGGIFIATSSRFVYHRPAIAPQKGLFTSSQGSPAQNNIYPFSEIISLHYHNKFPVPKNMIEAIVSEYPSSYQPPVSQVAQATTSQGWEITFGDGRFLRFLNLPNNWFGMKQLRYWEWVFRITLGVTRSDLDYIPYPDPSIRR